MNGCLCAVFAYVINSDRFGRFRPSLYLFLFRPNFPGVEGTSTSESIAFLQFISGRTPIEASVAIKTIYKRKDRF